jgi:hypothetical protein
VSAEPKLSFVLADRLLQSHHLLLGPGISRSTAVVKAAAACEDINHAKLAMRQVSAVVQPMRSIQVW